MQILVIVSTRYKEINIKSAQILYYACNIICSEKYLRKLII